MSASPAALTRAERADMGALLLEIRDRLGRAGGMIAAVHIPHALDCLAAGSSSPA